MLHQIGVGALGPVFRTYEPERDRLVAVKAFRLDITPEQARTLADELSRAADAGLFHPSIVEPIAAGVQGTLAYSAEEYVAAESLDVAMRHYAPAPIATVLPFITQLAGAIDFARAAGVGHGALHPRDIFVTPEEARATGFGVVEALERVGVRAPVRRPYTAPERIAGESWATAADVFSLAAITYELLTSRRPSGLGREIGTLTAGTPNAWMDSLHSVLARAMDPDPSARFPTALAFASALEASARGVGADATVVPPAAVVVPEVDTAATVVNPRAAAAALGLTTVAAVSTSGTTTAAADNARNDRKDDAKTVVEEELEEQEEQDDILAERFDDEADHELRLADRDDLFRRDPSVPLDDDIAAEVEADRFAPDDFLLDAAGAASAGTTTSDDTKPRDLPIDRDDQDTLVGAGPLRDDRVVRDEPRSHQDLPDEETIRRPRAAIVNDHRSITAAAPFDVAQGAPSPSRGAPPTLRTFEEPAAARSPFGMILLVIACIGVGLLAGYALWGRGTPASTGNTVTAATSGSTTGGAAAATGREFSEQAVTPPAPRATDSPSPGRGGSKPEAPRTDDRGAATPAGTPPPSPSAAAAPPPAATTGTLVVRSTPSGAGVTLNGRWRGRTPLTLADLPFRRYDVRVVQPGFVVATQAVDLSADTPARSIALPLKPVAKSTPAPRQAPATGARATTRPAPEPEPQSSSSTVYTGSIYVDSRPRGARVSIDGKPVGVTPLRVSDVRIGTHVVRLELPDHRLWSSTTRVTAGQEQRVTGSLERIQ